MAISLDIKNAFNTLPWDRVGHALRNRGVPQYCVGVIREYFRDWDLTYIGQDGRRQEKSIRCGVPQESVLGPLLWATSRMIRYSACLSPVAATPSAMQMIR